MAGDPPESEKASGRPDDAPCAEGSPNGSRRRRAPTLANPDMRSLTDGDQTTSDTDQTLSDADQSASEHDQTSAEHDQVASDSDQAASDHDLASGTDPAAYEFSRGIRQRSTRQREHTARERLRAAGQRDSAAGVRDLAALARDQAADARDLAMAQLDAAAEEHERSRTRSAIELVVRAAEQRKRAAEHRAQAANYRLLAARDRQAAARDRQEMAREREQARADREALAVEVERAAFDSLTGARTRGVGLSELDQEVERARRTTRPLVVAYVDVVGLKVVNDARGHAAGDALLKHVVTQIKLRVRPYDLIVRLGGDEFLCVMSSSTMETAQRRFDAIDLGLRSTSGRSAIRTGLAQLHDHETAAELIARADSELIRGRD
jgi:diguanylate cyclase (GGDEF)-like protein